MPVARGPFAGGYQLGAPANDLPTRVAGFGLPSRVFARSSSSCTSTNSNLCEKPASGNSNATTIAVAIVVPIAAICIVLAFLHRRNVKRQRREDAMDPHKSLDFGLALDPTQPSHTKRKSLFRGAAEKETMGGSGGPITRPRQLSIDMNLSSPYLLPPELQSSRESLHSLARTLHQNEDPYRPVTQYTTSEIGSLRSFRRDARDGSSIYTGSASSTADDGSGLPRSGNSTGRLAPMSQKSRHLSSNVSSRSRSPAPPPYPDDKNSNPFNMPTMPAPAKDSFILEPSAAIEDTGITKAGTAVTTSNVQVPAPTARIARKGVAPAPPPPRIQEPTAAAVSHRSVSEAGTVEEPFIYDSPGTLSKGASKPSSDAGSSAFPMPPRGASLSGELPARRSSATNGPLSSAIAPAVAVTPIVEDPSEHFDESQEGDRGRSTQRRPSSEYPQDNSQAPTLPLPEFDTRRLSAGFRPLPPDELLDSEDPETRANRIRSFYKEYFDERKPDMDEYNRNFPPQGIPAQYRGSSRNGGGNQYYEDYDPAYAGNNAYIDKRSNAFVMPYAQPVSRRAMTPPPSGSRLPGPRPHGGPRNFHGSMGGPGPFRPGSSNSGPRPGSSMSNQYGRPSSNMSGRYGGGPRRPIPPPMDLATLPTPSKLKDDTLGLITVTDFAPPPTYKDQAAGRSQSPLGERIPYQMKTAVSSPLVSSFDEMAALPSPHLLRKSGTFNNLDFAPPRRFKDSDTMSETGSIRSNRSGISAVSQAAIRSGAGRVSRLPGDTVFSQAAQIDQLKPQWGMRN